MSALTPRLVITFDLAPAFAALLRDIVESPRAGFDPRLAPLRAANAMVEGERVWWSDGCEIQCARRTGERLLRGQITQSRELAPLLARLRSSVGEATIAPLAALDERRTLWLLDGYDEAHEESVTLPVIVEHGPTPRLWPLTPTGRMRGLRPSEAKVVLGSPTDTNTFFITGSIDAGALMHLDDYLDVATAYRLDLTLGTITWEQDAIRGRPLPRTSTVGTFHAYTDVEGRTFTGARLWRDRRDAYVADVSLLGVPHIIELPCDPSAHPSLAPSAPHGALRAVSTLMRDDEVVVLDLRSLDRAVVRAWGGPEESTESAPRGTAPRRSLGAFLEQLGCGVAPAWSPDVVRQAWERCDDFDTAIDVLLAGAKLGIFTIDGLRVEDAARRDRVLARLCFDGRYYRIDAQRDEGAEGIRRCFPGFPSDWPRALAAELARLGPLERLRCDLDNGRPAVHLDAAQAAWRTCRDPSLMVAILRRLGQADAVSEIASRDLLDGGQGCDHGWAAYERASLQLVAAIRDRFPLIPIADGSRPVSG